MHQYPKLYLYRRIVQAKLFIDSHYAFDIDLGQVAKEASFSRFHFMRLFKQAYGRTPHHYLTHVRITYARQLLCSGQPVADVCFRVGFSSVTSFAALFRKHCGQSPSAYQRRQLQKQALFRKEPLCAVPNCFAEMYGLKNSNIQ